jgi:hypothetical protein
LLLVLLLAWWLVCTAAEQHFIKYVLAFFAGSDGIVLENLAVRFMQGECWGLEVDSQQRQQRHQQQ